ncbi:MAG: translocation/assembly module TamB domain-containing protein, partial [Azoarcus sp.]|nr:translocation/assembly module TamB domain-containing protein [Azoarcus sp.]
DLPGANVELVEVAFDWQPGALFSRQFAVTRLRVDKAVVLLRETQSSPSTEPSSLPESLRLPINFDLAALEIGMVEIYGSGELHSDDDKGSAEKHDNTPIFVLREGRLSARGEMTGVHLRGLAANLPQGHVELEGELGTDTPYALRIKGRLAAEAFSVDVDGEGSLSETVLRLQTQGWGVQGKATVVATPFAPLPLKTLELDVDGFDPAALAPGLPRAELRLHTRLGATAGSDAGKPFWRGPLRIDNARPATFDANGIPFIRLDAELSAAMDELRLDAFTLEGGGGKLTGWLRWQKDTAEQDSHAGTDINMDADAILPAGLGRLDAAFEVSALNPARFDSRLPSRRLEGRLEAAASAQRQQGKVSLCVGAARLEGDAEIVASAARAPAFVLNLDVRDLDPSAVISASPSASIKLRASATGVLAARPLAAVHYVFGESRFNGKPLSGNGLLTWDGTHVRDAHLNIEIAGNHLNLAGAWGEVGDHLHLEIDAPKLAAVGYGLGGQARANGQITGGLSAPAGTLKLDAANLHLPGTLDIAALAGEAHITAGDTGPLDLSLKISGLIAGEARVDTARLIAEGRRDLHKIRLDAGGKFGADAVTLAVALEGGLHETFWRGWLESLESGGRWPLRLRAPAELEVDIGGAAKLSLVGAGFDSGKHGRIDLTETCWNNGAAVLRGSLRGLTPMAIPMVQPSRRDPLVIGADWDVQIGESIEGKAKLFRESGDLSARGEISTWLGLERLEAYLFAHDRKLSMVFAAHGREIGELGVSLELGVMRDKQGWRLAGHTPLSGAAHLDMPSIAWLGRLTRENVEIGGALAADVIFGGTPDAPDLQGKLKGRALQLSFVDQGLLLAGGELEAGFTHAGGRQSLRLERLEFESPNRVKPRENRVPYAELTATPGRLRITGNVALGVSAELESGQRGKFEFTADRLPLLQRSDRWLIVSGQGMAALEGKVLNVDARLGADAGYFKIDDTPAPSLGDDVVVRGKGGTEKTAAAGGGEGLAIAGKIAVDPGHALYLDAFGVDTRLAGNLDVELRPSASPRVLGLIHTVKGSYRGYGQRLNIERGAIAFQGDPGNPGINIVAMRRGMEVDAGVAITGDVHHPQVKLVSEPMVPDPEKLSWLILGRAPDAAGSELALLMPAAQALFGSSGGGASEDLMRGLGFDSFNIGQGDLNSAHRRATSKVAGGGSRIDSGPTVSSDVVSVGKRLTNDLSLSFEQSLGGAESLVKLTYRLSRRLSLVARGGTDNALDMYYTYIFRKKENTRKEEKETIQ